MPSSRCAFLHFFSAFLFVSASLTAPAQSMTFAVDENASLRWFYGSGPIEEEDAASFARLAETWPEVKWLVLNSDGGSLRGGLELGRAIRKLQFTTYVAAKQRCFSSCFFAYIGGLKRLVSEEGGQLGVHQFYGGNDTPAVVQSQTQAVSAELLNFIAKMDVAISAFEIALQTPPDQMHVFSRKELAYYRLEGEAAIILSGPPRNEDCPFPEDFDLHDPLNLYPGCH